jgi:hypothetical protein
MNCLILESNAGISFQFDELLEEGEIIFRQKQSGIKRHYPIFKTNFVQLNPFLLFTETVEIEVMSDDKLLARKTIKV